MRDLRPDVFEQMRKSFLESDDVAHVVSLRASKGGRMRDGIMMSAYTPDFMRRVNFSFPGGDPDHVPISLTLFRDENKPDANSILYISLDIEDLKQFVNQAQALITDVERSIGRIGE